MPIWRFSKSGDFGLGSWLHRFDAGPAGHCGVF